MKAKKIVIGACSIALVAGLASCGKNSSDSGLTVCLASTPQYMDPQLNSTVDGASYAVHAFAGLVRYYPNANGELELSPDLCESLPEPVAILEGEDAGKVKYTFTLRDNIKFSNGNAITASDVVKSWNRGASYSPSGTTLEALNGDYSYMFEAIDGYDSLNNEGTTQADVANFLNVTAVDDKTLEVVLPVNVPYFLELCAFPTYSVLDTSSVDNEGTWAKTPGFVSSGAYTMTEYRADVKIVFEKNPNYWDAENVTCEKITFALSSDDNAILAGFNNGTYSFIDSIAQDSLATVSQNDKIYHNIGQLGTYYISWNINDDDINWPSFIDNEAERATARRAVSLLFDRQHICNSVTGSGQTPSTGYVGSGLTDPQGGEFVDHNGVAGDGTGYNGDVTNYEANKTTALGMLSDLGFTVSNGKVTNFPSIGYLYNTGTGNQKVAEYLQQALSEVGITLNVSNQEWNSFVETRKSGDYSVARNGWLADYNDPISFLDMWVTSSGNNDSQFGKGDHASYNGYSVTLPTGITIDGKDTLTGTWADTYDRIIEEVKASSDANTRYALMHKAEDLLMSTGCITSLYNYTDNYLQAENLKNVYASPLGYKYFIWATM